MERPLFDDLVQSLNVKVAQATHETPFSPRGVKRGI